MDRVRPDVVVLAGDLTSDGHAAFWREAVEFIPDFRKEKARLLEKFDISQVKHMPKDYKWVVVTDGWVYYSKSGNLSGFRDRLDALIHRYQQTDEFQVARREIHVNRFYGFLRHAGKKARVLVVKGDHDDDFEGDYLPEKVNRILGCSEISGRTFEVGGVTFLGLGFADTHYLTRLRPLISEFAGRADVVICHAEQRRVPLVSEFRPRVIIRGHFDLGRYLVAGVPVVFTQAAHYSVISLDGGVSMQQRFETTELSRESRRQESLTRRLWPWLTPYVG